MRKGSTEKSRRKIRERIETYKHFFNWPALFESLERDLVKDCSQEESRKKISGKTKNER